MLDKLKELKLKYQILLLKSNTMMQKLQKNENLLSLFQSKQLVIMQKLQKLEIKDQIKKVVTKGYIITSLIWYSSDNRGKMEDLTYMLGKYYFSHDSSQDYLISYPLFNNIFSQVKRTIWKLAGLF